MQQRLSINCLPITLVFRESCELFYQNEHKFFIPISTKNYFFFNLSYDIHIQRKQKQKQQKVKNKRRKYT